jgi:hypothetical protein
MLKAAAAGVAAFYALIGTAAAGPLEPGQWAGSISAGAELPVSGDVHGGATAPVADLGPLNPALAGVSAELRIQARDYDEIYGETTTFGVELARGLEGDREVFASLRYAQADEGTVQVGTAFVPALNASLPVFGTFGEFQATTIEGGARQYFGAGAWRPYVAGRIGAAFVDEINATFRIPDASITIANAKFYDSSTVLSVGGDVGLSYAVTDRFSVAAEVGVRYTGELKDDDSSIGGLGLGSINDAGERVSFPIAVRGRLAF